MALKPKSRRIIRVRGTEITQTDSRKVYRQKLARITLDSMVQFVGLLDARGTVLEINHVALDAVGVALSEVEGKPFWKTFWWQVSKDINATLRKAIVRAAKGEFVRWDAEIYGRAGGKETIIIDASLSPVKDEQGRVVYITAEGRDITEKKAQEREIARKNVELQALLERVSELDKLKTQFFANVSHEFRTPLTLMLGPLEESLADSGNPLAPLQRERQELIYRNSVRLLKLVNTLLDFSRIEAKKVSAVFRPTALAELTQDLVSVFRSAVERAGLKLIVNAPPLAEPVYVDNEMWEKVILNLLSNALKFTFTGEIEVSVLQRKNQVEIKVRDTGTGIPRSQLGRVFDRFHRVAGAKGRTHEGSGIGLALTQELIKLHGGTISVASKLGQGTVFTVKIPLGKNHLPQDCLREEPAGGISEMISRGFEEEAQRWSADPTSVSAPGLPAQPSTLSPDRVLVADDNADLRLYLKGILSPYWHVEAAVDGSDALAMALKNPPDLILSDVMMPGLDGFALLRELKKNPKTQSIPFIMLSARAGEESKIEGLEGGADDYVIKPFSAAELIARVQSQLSLSRMRRELTENLERQVRKRTQELQNAKDQIEASLGEKEVLLKEIHHRVKNNLQIISSFLRMQLSRLKTPGVAPHLVQSQHRIHSMALIHELLYQSKDFQHIPFKEYLLKLMTQIYALSDVTAQITFSVEGEEIALDLDTALPCGLIINELVTNVNKHAFPNGREGTVRLRLDREDERTILVTLEDNGVGFSRDIRWEQTQTMGFTVVRALVRQIGGTLTAYQPSGGGSGFTLLVPCSDPVPARRSSLAV